MKKIERCVNSLEDCIISEQNKINCVLLVGGSKTKGITPSLGTFLLAKEQTNLEIICLLRPQEKNDNLNYDIETMFLDAKLFLEEDVFGLAFSFINNDKTIDFENTNKMIKLIHSYGKKAFFYCDLNQIDEQIKKLFINGIDYLLINDFDIKNRNDLIFQLLEKYHNKIEVIQGVNKYIRYN